MSLAAALIAIQKHLRTQGSACAAEVYVYALFKAAADGNDELELRTLLEGGSDPVALFTSLAKTARKAQLEENDRHAQSSKPRRAPHKSR